MSDIDSLRNLLVNFNGHETNTVMNALQQLREYIKTQDCVEGLFRIYEGDENQQVTYIVYDFLPQKYDNNSLIYRLDLLLVLS